jgi:hypothetical protein
MRADAQKQQEAMQKIIDERHHKQELVDLYEIENRL